MVMQNVFICLIKYSSVFLEKMRVNQSAKRKHCTISNLKFVIMLIKVHHQGTTLREDPN
jgi:hypothetical protein